MQDARELNEIVARESAFIDRIESEVGKVIVGQTYMIERILIGLLTGGHVLLEGVPGLAKTLTVRTLCEAISAKFARVQFTPDLLPADVIGTVIYNQQKGEFTSKLGPIFANLVLADEINRAPAKTQSALLEAMQDRQVTVDGTSRPLPSPFVVVATQNPVESQGTYPLPEAQLDRFLVKLTVEDPPRDVEQTIVRRHADGFDPSDLSALQAAVSPAEIAEMQAHAQSVRCDDAIIAYIVDVVRRTRDDRAIELGASPRASIALMKTAQVFAASQGRAFVTPDDVKPMFAPVLRHRVMLHPDAQLQGVTPDDRILEIVRAAPVPRMA